MRINHNHVSAFLIAAMAGIMASVEPAHAYIGPGLGLGAVGVVFGFIFSVFVAIVAVFWYPIKRMLRKKKAGMIAENKLAGNE